MPHERLSDHCSLMARPGGPPPPKERPADCPKDGAYIKMVDKGGAMSIPGSPPFPIVFEGGDGDDQLTVRGGPGKGVIFDGGKGNDGMTIGSDSTPVLLVGQIGAGGMLFLAALAIMLAAIVIIAWRALGANPQR